MIYMERCLLTYITATIHLFELIEVRFEGGQVFLLHIAEEVLDGHGGHLYRSGGVHDCFSPTGHPGHRYITLRNTFTLGVIYSCYSPTQHRAHQVYVI